MWAKKAIFGTKGTLQDIMVSENTCVYQTYDLPIAQGAILLSRKVPAFSKAAALLPVS